MNLAHINITRQHTNTKMIRKWLSLSFLALMLMTDATSTSAFVIPSGAIVAAPKSRATTTTTTSTTGLHGVAPGPAVDVNHVSSVRNLAVAGRIPWHKLIISKSQARKVVSVMRAETHMMDVAMVLIFSFCPQRIGRFFYDKILYRLRKDVDYDDSITCEVMKTVGEASRLAGLCYLIDAVEVALEISGLKGSKVDVSTRIAKLIYATWALFKVRLYKRSFFQTFIDRTAPQKVVQGKEGIVEIFDKVSDFFVFGVLSLVWIDILKIKVGNGLSSLFALGGAGTFVLTLATQDLAKRALNGLALSASDAFNVGDSIVLGDGTAGVVTSLGWLNTGMRGFDESLTVIPNTQLSGVRISNRSRMKFSQVKQTLHFRYRDLDKIPKLVTSIREEIAKSCPKVITDGSRVFRVKMTDFSRDCVEVLVDCRLRNPPSGEPYYEARQGILEAIARAVKKEEVEFAMPAIERVNE